MWHGAEAAATEGKMRAKRSGDNLHIQGKWAVIVKPTQNSTRLLALYPYQYNSVLHVPCHANDTHGQRDLQSKHGEVKLDVDVCS